MDHYYFESTWLKLKRVDDKQIKDSTDSRDDFKHLCGYVKHKHADFEKKLETHVSGIKRVMNHRFEELEKKNRTYASDTRFAEMNHRLEELEKKNQTATNLFVGLIIVVLCFWLF